MMSHTGQQLSANTSVLQPTHLKTKVSLYDLLVAVCTDPPQLYRLYYNAAFSWETLTPGIHQELALTNATHTKPFADQAHQPLQWPPTVEHHTSTTV